MVLCMWLAVRCWLCMCVVCCQAEDGIRDLVRSRGLGDVYKRQVNESLVAMLGRSRDDLIGLTVEDISHPDDWQRNACLLYTSDAADERSSVDLGGRRIIKKKKKM